MKNPLNDKDFLKKLDLKKNKKTYIKILNLTFDEVVRESIEGKVTSGSINIDGDSAVRRTCSLSMIAEDININNYLWSINTKVRIFIGVENDIDSKYEKIIWFNQGLFILTSFNVSYTSNNYTINLSGQDKMCLLNGSIGGALPASIDFKQEVLNTKTYEKIELGPLFVPNLYQVVDESDFLIDSEDVFDSNKQYYKKIFKVYKPINNITEENYNDFKLYIENPEIYMNLKKYLNITYNVPITKLLSSEELQICLNDKISVYMEDEENKMTLINLANKEDFKFDNTISYYVDRSFIPLEDYTDFDDFEHYYIRDKETNKISEIYLDGQKFSEQENNLYIENNFILAPEKFNKEQQYFILQDGDYEEIKLSEFSYKPNYYFYEDIISYQPAEEEFNSSTKYYDLQGNYIDFYEKAYNLYQSNKYYIKNVYEDDYILYDGEYNPVLEYYEKKVFFDKKDVPIKNIIKEAVHTYGREPYYNIIINDIDDEGLLLKEYIGEEPLFLLINNGICENISNENQKCYVIDSNIEESTISLYISLMEEELLRAKGQYQQKKINKDEYEKLRENIINVLVSSLDAAQTTINDSDKIIYNSFIEDFDKNPSKIFFVNENSVEIKIYTVLKIEKGDAAGYELTDLTYPYDLISSPGEALTSILDKIKEVLGNFEYFYDVDGHFVFQKKKTYLNTSWNNIITSDNETYATSAVDTSAVQYTFEDNDLITSIGNNIKLDNLKNDYSVWGSRKTINGVEVPIHARFAIDEKPYVYVTFPRSKYNYVDKTENLKIQVINDLQYLYQDVYVNKDYEDEVLGLDYDYAPEGYVYNKVRVEPTLYKGTMFAGIYYNYIICDWREIIYQMALDYYKHNQENDFLANLSQYNTFDIQEYSEGDIDNDFIVLIRKNGGKLYLNGVTGYEQYYEDMESFWRELYNPEPEVDTGYTGGYYLNKEWKELIQDYSNFKCDYYLPEEEYDKYSDLLNQAIESLEKKIKELQDELDQYKNDADLNDLLNELDDLSEKLKKAKEKKNILLKSYYTQKLFVFNDPEYRELQKQYSKIEKEKESLISNTESKIISILKDSFELY